MSKLCTVAPWAMGACYKLGHRKSLASCAGAVSR
jgi:hypothetical protein